MDRYEALPPLEHELAQAIQTAELLAQELHQQPERSFQEYRTTERILDFCRSCDVQFIDTGMPTGVVAFLHRNRAQTVALRADIDAVPTATGAAHLCGHDYHTAALLGAMQYLSRKPELPYNVAFLFQPAEECTQGAAAMLRCGLMERLPQAPFRLFGIHNRPEIPCGQIAVHAGALMAEKTNFTVRFTGRTGHGGSPHQCVDPLVAAAQFTVGAQTIVSRNVDPLEAAVCAVCSFHSGTAENFAPQTAELTGSIRTLHHPVHQRIMERLAALAEETARGYECACDIEWQPQVPAVVNSDALYPIALRAAEKAATRQGVVDTLPCLGSEDFAVLGQAIPSFFYWVGSGEKGKASGAWHSDTFKIADGYLNTAVPLLVYSAIEP